MAKEVCMEQVSLIRKAYSFETREGEKMEGYTYYLCVGPAKIKIKSGEPLDSAMFELISAYVPFQEVKDEDEV